ncbi:hypothetical protein BURK2_03065 [Burkholderiales bacterium]|nr:MAG: hypothetical protein F9K47_02025 [Burkholderiales bacterium]CAG1001611.1 hypothetical protein BURK2_03065 [Burkholderiales bacterium]
MKRKRPHAPPRDLKPRNPVVLALQKGQGARGGAHGKSTGALRRKADRELQKRLREEGAEE